MDCQRIAELLPWFMNNTLKAEEQEQVRVHLAECPTCQRELNETIVAMAVYQQHVPTEVLVDYVFERPVTIERHQIERHLKTCPACAEQLALVRESRRLAEEGTADVKSIVREKIPWWPALRWSYVALAAGLIGVIAFVGWLWSWQQVRALQARWTEQQAATRERLASLEAENQRLRHAEAQRREQESQAKQEIARLSERIKDLLSPQLNIPVLDVYPVGLTRRAGRPAVNELQVPPGAKVITLILNSQSASTYPAYSLDIIDAQNKVVWSAQGLVRQSTGDYTISLPTELLPPGRYTLAVYGKANGQRVRVDTYPIRIVTRS